jgi:ABC-type sugar transport system ATPase subunit
MMENETLLEMKHITKRFFTVRALDDVSINLHKGEILALVGENGAGKSTLMKILSGSYPHTSYDGEIFIDGEKHLFNHTYDAKKSGIEMIYQEISLMGDLTVTENILMGKLPETKLKGIVNWKKSREKAQEALDIISLKIDPDEIVRRLSTSQMQMLSIAKAVYQNPRILVLDEPTSALTENETHELMRILETLKVKEIGCIYISHKLDEVFACMDRVVVLRDGKAISTYTKDNFVPAKVIEDMVGRKVDTMYPKADVKPGKEMLRVENFVVPSRIPGKNVISNVSFSVREGEVVGLGGLVGAGRSELVNAIFGAIPRSSGEVYVDGEKAVIEKPFDAIKYKMALLTEDRKASGYVGSMTVRENISLASFRKISKQGILNPKSEKNQTSDQFKSLNVKAPGIETNIMNLSGGNQQKVVLAKWLMSEAKILFLDEPTRGIDIGAKVEIYSLMAELVRQGAAIVLISSELPEFLALCDRFIIMYEGKPKGEFERGKFDEKTFVRVATNID